MDFIYRTAFRLFTDYAARFARTVMHKEVAEKNLHTFYVIENCRLLASSLSLSREMTYLALLAGLLHDIGRFPQLSRWHTFRDRDSANHAALSTDWFLASPLPALLTERQKNLLLFAVYNHNAKILPPAPKDALLLAKLLRDADKLDIYRVLSPTVSPSTKEGCSPALVRSFLAKEQADYSLMQTPDDRKLFRLLWLYDVNFPYTAAQLLQSPYLAELIRTLPPQPLLRQGTNEVLSFLTRLSAGSPVS